MVSRPGEQSLGVEFQYPAAIANGDTLVAAGDPGNLDSLVKSLCRSN